MSITYEGTIYEELSVDVSQQNEFAPRLVKQGDAYTRGYIITLTENGEPLTIPTANTTAWFNCRNQTDVTKRASATGTINSNGTVTVKVPTVVMEVAGYIQCDISIITASGNDTNILKSTLFYLNCEEAANPDGTTTAAEDSILAGIAAGTISVPGSYVPKTRKVAGIDLQDDITPEELKSALSVPDISNKADKATSLSGYGITDAYTKTETDSRISTAIAGVTGLSFQVVQSLPPIQGAYSNIIYLVPKSSAEQDDVYDEWAAINNQWEHLGSTQIDLSGKVDKTRKIAGVDLQDDITALELKTALSVPTKTSDLTNYSGFLTQHQDISGKMNLASLYSGGSTEDIELGQLFLTRRGLSDYNLNIQLSQSGESGRQIAWASDIPDVSGKQDKQTSLPEVATVEYHGEWIPDTSDIVFQNLSIGQLFQCDILEVVHIYQKTSASTYFDLHGVLHTEDLPTNVSAFINDAGYLTAQGITGKMDLAQIRASIDDDTQIKQGQFLVVGGNVWLKTNAYGAPGHLVLEDQANRVSAIDNISDNLHYPTALAVKNYVDTVIGGIENGSY